MRSGTKVKGIAGAVYSLVAFQAWMQENGFSYLERGVGQMPVGDAIMEIAKRAGVRGLKETDVIHETLPMIKDLIRLRCKPQWLTG